MVNIVNEIVQHASKRGFTFSPNSRSALLHDFPKIQELSNIDRNRREILYDLIPDQVAAQLGPPPRQLHEDSIPNAAQAVSEKFKKGGMTQFNESEVGIIKDCCPYC